MANTLANVYELVRRGEVIDAALVDTAIAAYVERSRAEARTVCVMLIGEYLDRGLELEAPGTRNDERLEGLERTGQPRETPRIRPGFMVENVGIRRGEPQEVYFRNDPMQRVWARGAWLIAFNGAHLSRIRVGDMAIGTSGDSPIAQLAHPIARGVHVRATVTLPEAL